MIKFLEFEYHSGKCANISDDEICDKFHFEKKTNIKIHIRMWANTSNETISVHMQDEECSLTSDKDFVNGFYVSFPLWQKLTNNAMNRFWFQKESNVGWLVMNTCFGSNNANKLRGYSSSFASFFIFQTIDTKFIIIIDSKCGNVYFGDEGCYML